MEDNFVALLNDREVARMLSISQNAVRTQRHYRRREQPHWFTVDPVMVGSLPRYRKPEIIDFIGQLT